MVINSSEGACYNSLSTAIEKSSSNMSLILKNSQYYVLCQNETISNKNSFSLKGVHTVIHCIGGTGLSFVNVNDVHITGLEMNGCHLSMIYSTTFHRALVSLSNFTLHNGKGVSLLYSSHITDHCTVTVYNATFTNNTNSGLTIESISLGNVTVNIILTKFVNNTGLNGGGLHVTNIDKLYIIKCDFIGNTAVHSGGGILLYGDTNHLLLLFTNFTGNLANSTGGGLAVRLTAHDIKASLVNCTFYQNKARKGAGVHIKCATSINNSPYDHYIQITNSSFNENSILHITNQSILVSEYATVVSHHLPVQLNGHCLFVRNNASGISIGASSVLLDGTVVFDSNSGMNGGAIALYDGSSLVVREDVDALFIANRAINKGPALYFSHLVPRLKEHCFVRYMSNRNYLFTNWSNCSMRFINNTISCGIAGAIYVSSLELCGTTKDDNSILMDIFCSHCWRYNTDCKRQVFTGPAVIANYSLFSAVPGKNTGIPVHTFDKLGHNISETEPLVTVSINSLSYETTDYGNYAQASTPFIMPFMSFTPHNATIRHSDVSLWSTGDTTATTVVRTVLKQCPPGFWFNRTIRACECVKIQSFIKCKSSWEYNIFYLKQGWLMTHDTNAVYLALQQYYQPLTVIDNEQEQIKGFIDLAKLNGMTGLNNFSCGPLKRQGLLCSQCQSNMSVSVSTYNPICVPCTSKGLWKRIALYVSLHFVPSVSFCLLLTTFNIGISSGSMNSFVIFSQIISNPLLVTHIEYQFNQVESHGGRILYHLLIIPYSIWNLDFFKTLIPPFCLSPSMTNISVWALQYITAVLPFLFILILYAFSELYFNGCRPIVCFAQPVYRCLARTKRCCKIHTNLVNTFVTFFLLSYTKLCSVSLSLLIPTMAYIYNGLEAYEPYSSSRVYLQPNYKYFGTEHLPYALVAIVVLVTFILIPPIFLILHSLGLFRCFRRPCLSLSAFTDIFQGTYKDGVSSNGRNYQYFSGLHLLLRLIVLCLLVIPFSDSLRYLFLPLLMATVVMTTTYLQPYKDTWVNLLDGILFSILISVIMMFAPLSASYQPLGDSLSLIIVMWILTMLPLLYMFIYSGYCLYGRCAEQIKRRENIIRDYQNECNIPYRLIADT